MDAAAASGEAEARGAAEHIKDNDQDSEESPGKTDSCPRRAGQVDDPKAPTTGTDATMEAASSTATTTKKANSKESENVDEAMDAAAASGEAEARGAAEHIKQKDQDRKVDRKRN